MKPMAEDVILKLDGMYKSFGATKAVRNVSMELHKGQVLALIGENGSGKSCFRISKSRYRNHDLFG